MVRDAAMKIFQPRSSTDFSPEYLPPRETLPVQQPVCPAHRLAEQVRRSLGRTCRI